MLYDNILNLPGFRVRGNKTQYSLLDIVGCVIQKRIMCFVASYSEPRKIIFLQLYVACSTMLAPFFSDQNLVDHFSPGTTQLL